MPERSWEERLLGQTIAGRYRLDGVQAAGAFGTVFQARQFFCGEFVRPVAVKISRQTGLTESTAVHAFRDALILARLQADHDHAGRRHLVPIYDLGLLPECAGRAFVAMEFVEGIALLEHLRVAGNLGIAHGLRILREICQALALVHAQGVIHRDLSADNILIDRRGRVRVVDFGLATLVEGSAGNPSVSLGKLAYVAPETLRGHVSAANDVYALGLLMHEMFGGTSPHHRTPWARDDASDRREENYRLKQALRFEPLALRHNQIRKENLWIDSVVQRCLAFDPERRFSDASAVLLALERAEPVTPLPEQFDDADEFDRATRRLLSEHAYSEVIERLEVRRPAEWAALDSRSARRLLHLSQAYVGEGNFTSALECLEQLRSAQQEQPVHSSDEIVLVLSLLTQVCGKLGLEDRGEAFHAELRRS